MEANAHLQRSAYKHCNSDICLYRLQQVHEHIVHYIQVSQNCEMQTILKLVHG